MKISENKFKVAVSATDALAAVPKVLDLNAVGVGTTHAFTSQNLNSKMLVALDNNIQAPLIQSPITSNLSADLGPETFLYGARLFWHSWDLFYGFCKAIVFGFVIPIISVHMGLRTSGGAEGVGIKTTQAVMFMILTILILDAMFPPLMLQ